MFVCNNCGYESANWAGKCPSCNEWNTFVEFKEAKIGKKSKKATKPVSKPTLLNKVSTKQSPRVNTGLNELNCVLGGGIVAGAAMLLGGEPGVGKSTLMLQIGNNLCKNGKKVLYVSGEESPAQIKIRANRLEINEDSFYLYCETEIEHILKQAVAMNPDLLIVDSIQAVESSSLGAASGSTSQLRHVAALLTKLAKQSNIPVMLIGHVTKQGVVAGPKIIEHMVDTVLYFEGEIRHQYKLLRAVKNRFGSTNEIGIFEMKNGGLTELTDPFEMFLSSNINTPGTAVGAVLEGSRAFLTETQSLVTAAGYGTPQRVAVGLDQKRLSMLLAIIEKASGIELKTWDVFVSVAGGIKVQEPSLDLAFVAAILSSLKEKVLPAKTIFLGELGLSGEVRAVSQTNKRLKEAARLGYKKAVVSHSTKTDVKNIELVKIEHIKQLFKIIS